MRPTRAQGRPGTKVVPDDWSATHAAVMDRTHPSSVTIGQPGGTPAWNPTTKQTETAAAAPVYSGPATIMPVDPGRAALVVDDPTSVSVYDVSLPYAASSAVAVGHVITVAPSDPDPMLAGATLRVLAVERGNRRFSRLLLATLLSTG